MSRLLKITDLGSGIMVQGTDNVLYPDNATLTYPYNSIVVVTDESDIATFRSASNNDVLFSGLIGKIEIGGEIVTKQNINAKFDAIANQESGGGGGDVTGLFADASYDSQTKHINFYDKDNTLVAYVDATAFIKDGMVDSVAITNGNLVITFNTDAGKEPITIPLTDIFNPNNYYTKTQTDNTFATQTVVNQEIAARIQGDADINTTLGTKADKSDTYTKTQVDTALAAKVSQTEFDTKEEVISTALNELDENKQDKLTAGANITIDANNVISASGGTQQQADWNQSDSTAVDYIKNKPTIPDTSDFVSINQYNPKELAIAEALTDLNENKADKTELPDVSTFATKTELNAKADASALTAHIGNTNVHFSEGQKSKYDGFEGQYYYDDSWDIMPLSVFNDFANDYSTAMGQFDQRITANANAIATKANAADVYTKTQTDAAIQTAVGQIDLSDYQTKEDADVKEEVISTALNNLAANKVNNLGGVANIVKISAADYAALVTKDNNTLYIITTN